MTAPVPAGGHTPDTVERAARAAHDAACGCGEITVYEGSYWARAATAALSVVPAPDDGLRVVELEAALRALVEAVSRGDGHGLPEAYRAARAAVAGAVPDGSGR